ncbi:energy-coupling factor ABC transporter ATP-binding protein [Vagococcus jeotgali]|uniref:energy-coupling factor ABC transporter ATP-binding protein n=1 Tax=Vagococcus jeotgali TaxID=3109030 RepID=UPI002DD7FCAC|nr:energy-coupling factor ABC transporter ATP-binding protein [Vagococcus sp. B2T-5]
MDIRFEEVDFTYQPNSPFEQRVLFDINLDIPKNSYTAIVGHTGSGKSTLLQHLNALLKPTKGKVLIGDREITPETSNKNLKPIRKKVGIVFQFPESQLFDETVGRDIAFGPKNFGVKEDEAMNIAREMLDVVGLDESYMDRSPFDLSGGQMRRVAIAGVLAMQPEVVILDEPTAGLDPKGRKDMMDMFYKLHKEKGISIILVTHLMDDVAEYADYMIVLEKGRIHKKGHPREIFNDITWLREKQLGVPTATEFAFDLMEKGVVFNKLPLTAEELAQELVPMLGDGQVTSHDE